MLTEQLGCDKMLTGTGRGGLLKTAEIAKTTAPPAICSAHDEEISLTTGHSATADVFYMPGKFSFHQHCFWICGMCAML
jgi:hypothetical protein